MRTVSTMAAQGDVLFRRVEALPSNLSEQRARPVVVAHSETGHHHCVQDGEVRYLKPADDTGPTAGLVAYLEVLSDHADVVHLRSTDTHETLRLPRGLWEIRRQREYTPRGWRRVED